MNTKGNVDQLVIFTDGGSRGNPGEAAYGFVVYDTSNNKLYEKGEKIGIATNNVAEYSGVLSALRWVRDLPHHPHTISFFMDSQLIAYQLSGKWKIKHESMRGFVNEIHNLIQELKVTVSYTPVPREKNKEADRMVNVALDS